MATIKSIEEKATAYDEAIEKLRDFYRDYDTVSRLIDVKEELANLFPELKESEDERIRKAIHIYLDWLDGRKDYAPKGEYSINDMIAWLEKQGEQKPVISNDALREGIAHFGITQYQIDNWLKKYVDVEKQVEQKPIMNVPPREVILSVWDLGNEWKELTNGSISTEHGTQLDYIQKHWKESEYYLRAKQSEQKTADKAESNLLTVERAKEMSPFMRSGFENEYAAWSEEDERYLSYAIHAVEDMLGNNGRNTVTWLKSLKDRYTWKPSDEQKNALYHIVRDFGKDKSEDEMLLESLLYDLDKL